MWIFKKYNTTLTSIKNKYLQCKQINTSLRKGRIGCSQQGVDRLEWETLRAQLKIHHSVSFILKVKKQPQRIHGASKKKHPTSSTLSCAYVCEGRREVKVKLFTVFFFLESLAEVRGGGWGSKFSGCLYEKPAYLWAPSLPSLSVLSFNRLLFLCSRSHTVAHLWSHNLSLAHTHRGVRPWQKLSNKSVSISLYYFSSFFPLLNQLLAFFFFSPGQCGFRLSKMWTALLHHVI